ncbi:hypothetical protein AAC387_Pa02g0910 [Persea americana]
MNDLFEVLIAWQEISTSTSSVTSVPNPLKFLRAHYGTLKAHYETMADLELKKHLANILSVLAFTMSEKGEQESLKYSLLGSEGDIGSCGYQYVRNLTVEIKDELVKSESEEKPIVDLLGLVGQIVAFHMKYNAEPEAVDLLVQAKATNRLLPYVDSRNYTRTCLYLTSVAR